jgi:hypothetical protein
LVLINNNDSLRDDGFVNTFDNPDYIFSHLISIDYVINIFYNKFSGFIWVGYTFIGIYALSVCLWGYVSNISCSKRKSKFSTFKASKSLNKDVKALIFRRQILYFLALLILETPYAMFVLIKLYFLIKGDTSFIKRYETENAIMTGLYIGRGIVLSLIRLSEPQFLTKLRNFFNNEQAEKSISIRSADQASLIQNDDPNIAFLSSSLNNMLVCGILKGIN